MKFKNLFFTAGFFVLVVMLGSCEEDEHVCVLPVYNGFSISPLQWNAGDSVTIKAVQKSIGNLLYKAEYKWSVVCVDTTFSKSESVVYDYVPDDPYIAFRLPEDFEDTYATISFNAQFYYSATAPTTSENGSSSGISGVYGSITSYAASQLYGTASGSYVLSW